MANTKIPSELIDATLGVAGISSSADATAITITSDENVGIGTSSPNQDGFDANATVLSVKSANNGEGVLELIGGGNSSGDQIAVINFMSQAQANPAGQIKALRGSADDEAGITFHNSGAQRMAINADGNITISNGLTVGTTVQPTSGELDGTGQSGTNVLTIGDTTKSLPAILMRSSVTNGSWLAWYGNTSGHLNSYNTDTNRTTMSQKSDGSVNFPNQPSFMAYTNASGTTGFITFTATHHNIGGHYNTGNGRFTAPVAGRYLFTFAILLNPDANGEYARILFAINGTTSVTYGDTLQDLNFSSLSDYHALSASTILSLNANDYVQLKNDSQFGTYGGSYGSFCGQLLS